MATWWRLCVCSLGILLLAPCSLSEKFSLAGSPRPVVGVIGRDVVLPCQLSPPARLPSMEVLWRKTGSGFIPVHKYSDEGTQDLPGEGYQTRTELFPQEFSSGNVSLKLKQLQVSDEGKYQCLVRNPEWTQEATIELRVAAVAPVLIDVLGPWSQGIGLACISAGWFPKPELQWVGKSGQNLAMEIVTNVTQDRDNLYSVVSQVTVIEGEDNGDISCIVRNGLMETEQQSAIHLSGDIFPRVSPWLAAFWVMFTLFLIAAGACAYLRFTAKRKAFEKKRSKEEALFILENDKKILESDLQELHQLLEAKTKAFESECQELHMMIEFRRARSYMVHVTLDPGCKHPELTVSENGRTVQHNPPSPGPAAPSEALIAVGREGFVARKDHGGICRWYWEVELGDSPDWELGVLSETMRDRVKQERLKRHPEGGCWVLGRSEGQYHSREADTVIQTWGVTPTVVGVYLDLGAGSLSFYNVNNMRLILEIPVEGSERLFPFLSPGHAAGGDQGKPLSICPPSDWDFPQTLKVSGFVSQGNPGAGNNTGPPATEETATAPGDKQVKENSAGPTVRKNVQNLLPTRWIPKWLKGHKTEQEHPQLETTPKQKMKKKHQNPQV